MRKVPAQWILCKKSENHSPSPGLPSDVIRNCGRWFLTWQGADVLSDVACRGRIRPPECRAVIVKHAASLTELRFRTSEIIEDLDRACKNADRKLIKELLVQDIIHGAGFGGPHAAAKAAEERAWSGLDAFRHVLEDEVELPKGSFDAILHSILDANVRDQG